MFDLGAAWRKLFGDASADVIPDVNFKQLNQSVDGKTMDVNKLNNPYVSDSEKKTILTGIEMAMGTGGGGGGGGGGAFDAAAAARAAEAAKLGAARNDVSGRVNAIKDIYNSRYGKVDQLAQEQTGKLNDRYSKESADVLKQVDTANQQIGAAHAAGGTYDSSYRGNNVDTQTKAGESQISDLGTELSDNTAKIGGWVSGQKASLDAGKANYDSLLANLGNETDVNNLINTKNQLEAKINELRAGEADYNTSGKNMEALNAIAPVSARTVTLKNNLATVLQGNSDPGMKLAIGKALITNSGLSNDEQQRLLLSFQDDATKKTQQA